MAAVDSRVEKVGKFIFSPDIILLSQQELHLSELKIKGLGIKIFDAYRPYKATVKFYEVYHDTTYVASPYKGSRHNRGCAIDMTLVELKTGKARCAARCRYFD